MCETIKLKGRIYVEVPIDTPQVNDVVQWASGYGLRTHKVTQVKGLYVHLQRHPHEGEKPFRILLKAVRRCWRWHGNMEGMKSD